MGDTSIRAMDMALELLGVSIDVRNAIRLNNERARQLADTNRIVVLCMLLRRHKKAMSRIPMQIWKTLALDELLILSKQCICMQKTRILRLKARNKNRAIDELYEMSNRQFFGLFRMNQASFVKLV